MDGGSIPPISTVPSREGEERETAVTLIGGGIVPVLLVVSGPPGTGKSTVADLVAPRLPAVRLSIDDLEDAMRACGLSAEETGVAAYEAVRAAAQQNLVLGSDVVVDAVNASTAARETWRRAAGASGTVLLLAVIDPPALSAMHRARLEGRARGFGALPEPRWDEVERLMAATEPWPHDAIRLSADRPAHELADDLVAAVSRRRASGSA